MQRLKFVITLALFAAAGLAASSADAATLKVCGSGCAFTSINAAIGAASAGDIISIGEGSFVENVVVDKPLTLRGTGQGATILMPSLSAPSPLLCPRSSSLCGGVASNIILVQADNVTISDLTLDGDNPALNGADLDARNGIITNHDSGVYEHLSVSAVTVQNVYLRGIYASSRGTFSFIRNTVHNVRGDASFSGAISSFGGAGTISGNTITEATAGIISNHSAGISIVHNVIVGTAAGVHTDNSGDAGGTPDTIDDNTISECATNGYGLYAFVPFLGPRFTNNTVLNCAVGMAVFGQGGVETTRFEGNVVEGGLVDGRPLVNSIGALASTRQPGFLGDSDASVAFIGNRIERFEAGLFADERSLSHVHVTASHNVIAGNTEGAAGAAALGVNAQNNWWGCNAGPGPGPGVTGCDTAAAAFLTDPWLVNRLTFTPSPIAPTEIATVTADLTFNSDEVQPGGGTVPAHTRITFDSFPAGTVFTPPTAEFSSGTASSEFAAAAGVDICARVPAEVATAALECARPNVSDPVPTEGCPAVIYPLTVGGSVTVTNTTRGKVDDLRSFCGDRTQAADTPDVVYAFRLPSEGTFRVNVTSLTAGYNPAVYLRTVCATDYACFNFGPTSELIAGDFTAGDYVFVVDGSGGTSGDFQLTASFTAARCGDGIVNPGEQCDPGAARPDDGCGDPDAPDACRFQRPPASQDLCPGTPITIPRGRSMPPEASNRTTVGFTNDYSGTCSFPPGGPDRIYQVIPEISGTMTVSVGLAADGVTPSCDISVTDPGCWDRTIYARTTCDDEAKAAELGCSDTGTVNVETITFPVTAGTPVFVFVDGYDDQDYSSGVFNLIFDLVE